MDVTTKTEKSVFITSLNKGEIDAALRSMGLSPTDNFELRPAVRDMVAADGVSVPQNGYIVCYCTETTEAVA